MKKILFSFLVDPDDLRVIREYCLKKGVPVARLIRGLIHDFVVNLKTPPYE